MDAAREQAMAEQIAGMRTDFGILSAEVRLMIQRVDPLLTDHEQRIRELEKRPQVANLPDRVAAVERWQWQREALLTLGGGGVGAAMLAAYTHLTGG